MAKKIYHKIGEACRILDIQPYVLRYWETEFPALSPNKSKSGQRVYSERDLAMIRRIKELLYDEGYTIAGAKKKLESEGEPAPLPRPAAAEKPAPKPKEAAAPAAEPAPKPKPATAKAKKKPAAPARKKPKPAAKAPADPAARLRQLDQGVRKALAEARKLQALLDTSGRKS